MARASIAIFPKKMEYSDSRAKPETPSEVFEAAKRVIQTETCELVRGKTGLYIVAYSENGPSKRPEGWENWLPVYVAKIEVWASGGIQTEELFEYERSKETENESHE
ncbi:MAG: hypothetical protein ACXAC5_01335 [Promethearchaeota archaeon]|jgi:hypothetical protein